MQAPVILYGTAWKEDRTRELTELAIEQGFRGIDTANQRKHYHEAAVGEAVAACIAAGRVTREELFLQTKFTFSPGQDNRLPYDPKAPIATQVEQSFSSSLDHLKTTWIDSYVLHGPSRANGLSEDDWAAWRAMEAIHDSGRARQLGVSNVSLTQLQLLYDGARVRPAFVQNRCYAATGWDHAVRQYCDSNGIIYQGFSLLTANRHVWQSQAVAEIASRHGQSPAQVIFRFARSVGMLPLTGTTDTQHMQDDLTAVSTLLPLTEVALLERLGVTR